MSRASCIFILTTLTFFALPVHTLNASERININTADTEELDTLPEIGPVYAERIILYREGPDGPFDTVEEIQNVSGIGPATFAKIEPYITVEDIQITPNGSDELMQSEDDRAGETTISVERLRIEAPQTTFVHQKVTFVATPSPAHKGRLVRYVWNFGDTERGEGATPIHHFEYPGTYVVTVESSYKGEYHTARHKVTVLPVMFSITRDSEGNIQINNDAAYEVDMGGFLLTSVDTFIIPEGTMLLPYQTLTVSREKVERGVYGVPRLYDSMRTFVAEYGDREESIPPADEPSEKISEQSSTSQDLKASVAAANIGHTQMAYIGLVGVLVIGTLGVYVRKREDDIEDL